MNSGNIKLLNDQAIGGVDSDRKDGLGFSTYSDIISRTIKGTPGPFTIGIFGEWGTGKTSLLKLIENNLSNDYNILPIWFNAWMYEKEDHPLLPLISTIVKEINANNTFWEHTKKVVRNDILNALRAVAYGFSSKSKLQIPGFAEIEASFVAKDMIDRESTRSTDPLLDKSIYYNSFERLASIKLPPHKKIVIFIDDLDRCFPDKAIKLLESIKLVLFQKGFIFVLGVARQVIEGYLSYRYKEDFGLIEFEGQKYLDKIVQLQFPIPPHNQRIKNFSSTLLNQLEPHDRNGLQPILPILGAACSYNPRATVRFINNLIIDCAISKALHSKVEDVDIPVFYFAITRGLQQRWRNVFNELVSSDELCQTVKAAGSDSDSPFPNDIDESFKDTIKYIHKDKDLHQFIFSNEGKSWLSNKKLRDFAIDFLRTQRQIQEPEVIEPRMFSPVKIRVYELAKDLNMTNRALLNLMKKKNINVKSHMSSLTDREIQLIKSEIEK